MKRDELLTKAAMEIERWPDEHTPIAHGLPYLCPGIVWGIHADEWCIRYPHVITRDEYLAERERLVLWQAIKPTSEDDASWHDFDESKGMKFDTEKPRPDLLLVDMPLAVEAVVRVLTFGAVKYAPNNWAKVDEAERRYLAAGLRHELAISKGEEADPETGEHHLAHKLCCDLFRLELALREKRQ